jgi:hypothetical protein
LPLAKSPQTIRERNVDISRVERICASYSSFFLNTVVDKSVRIRLFGHKAVGYWAFLPTDEQTEAVKINSNGNTP